MGKAACDYVSSFVLLIWAVLSFVLAVIVEIYDKQQQSFFDVVFSIPSSSAFAAGCIFLVASFLLLALGFDQFLPYHVLLMFTLLFPLFSRSDAK
jgi:hypothetical protein